jgi:hypothetical protein
MRATVPYEDFEERGDFAVREIEWSKIELGEEFRVVVSRKNIQTYLEH